MCFLIYLCVFFFCFAAFFNADIMSFEESDDGRITSTVTLYTPAVEEYVLNLTGSGLKFTSVSSYRY